MKIAASRQKDQPDINRLIDALGISDPEQIADIAFSVFGEHSIALGDDRGEVLLLAEEALRRYRLHQARPGTR